MSLDNVEKFFATAARLQQAPGATLKGTIDGVEFSGAELIKAAVAKGKKLGCEFTFEDAAAWIERQWRSTSPAQLSDGEINRIAAVLSERDKWLESGR